MIGLFGVAVAGGWELEAQLGGQFEAESHGIVNLSARSGGLQLALITDTLQVRYDGREDRGRWWLAARGEYGAPGLVSTRWIDGAPSAEASQLGYYAGPEGGYVRYGPKGTYAGLQGSVRYYGFKGLPDTVSVEPARPIAQPELVLGWWTEGAELYLRGGVAVSPGTVSPGLHGVFKLHPTARFTPVFELRAGVAQNTDIITKTRLGGLNPYVVPLAGAAWAEFWVEDYAAVRAGPRVGLGSHSVSAVVDAASFDGRSALGVGGYAHLGFDGDDKVRFALDIGVGVAPVGVLRPARGWAGSSFVLGTVGF